MSVLQALVLGLVQGLAEFLPISSSGHLKLAEHFLKVHLDQSLAFEVLLHVGTLLAMLVYFREDLKRVGKAFCGSLRSTLSKGGWARLDSDPDAKWGWLVVLTMLPTGVVAVLLRDWFEAVSANIMVVASLLLVTGLLNAYADSRTRDTTREGKSIEELGIKEALACGLAQSVALLNGVSRSGSTIAAGLGCGLDNDAAPRFAFLMAIPAIAGAALVELPKLGQGVAVGWFPLLVGFTAAAVSGYWALTTVFRVVRQAKLRVFVYYCCGIGLLSLILVRLGY